MKEINVFGGIMSAVNKSLLCCVGVNVNGERKFCGALLKAFCSSIGIDWRNLLEIRCMQRMSTDDVSSARLFWKCRCPIHQCLREVCLGLARSASRLRTSASARRRMSSYAIAMDVIHLKSATWAARPDAATDFERSRRRALSRLRSHRCAATADRTLAVYLQN